jgi:hypothetical protein
VFFGLRQCRFFSPSFLTLIWLEKLIVIRELGGVVGSVHGLCFSESLKS